MSKTIDLTGLRGGMVVSCQAYPGDATYGSEIMVRFALAALEGGALAIRANSPPDISAIKQAVKVPVIGLWKRVYADSDVYITATRADAMAVVTAGADIVALDATARRRPGGESLQEVVSYLKRETDALLMADVSTLEEGIQAERLGFDIVSTTLSGYTPYSPQTSDPDYALIAALSRSIRVPVFAEGRIHTPEQARRCLENGAHTVVVGTALTRPHVMTRKFVDEISHVRDRSQVERG
ncbi:N-acetylmannosamine-6-phosphate 2-epimerase [Cohnella nanjingensis]|uniref:Putative N-acetylmannosamine-6-phosphate 2-epimerase n=1 Tax=Cohnella nanjingensis TaxID=1387779 RepID=A0A7X0VID3_9BACL|nr:N-acetylmannosamine-6-phosphate 2-epimerase [Cohnella nanjingensis]MBB6675100.1 N-acetylmannosamine-6-phosphate 2-epimerase [Cohnella nanjingensis]